MTRILLLWLTLHSLSSAQSTIDQDMDGVPDTIDQCIDTPFLDEVDSQGCSTNTLKLPEEKDNDGLDISFGYGFSNNEDLIGRDTQYTTKVQITYYHNTWSYSLRTGYFKTDSDNGMQDTTLKIKRKFKLTKSLKLGLGLGVKLPTYDFIGNKTDYTFYSSLTYYPQSSLSIFTGVSHTFINDEQTITPLRNTNTFYIGTGYYFTSHFYANIAYSYAQSKFTTEHAANSIMSTLFYKINKKWFTTLSYSHEIDDEDLHNSLNIKFGYSIW
jgi:hypothetical protein